MSNVRINCGEKHERRYHVPTFQTIYVKSTIFQVKS